jgi:hypothetical protein
MTTRIKTFCVALCATAVLAWSNIALAAGPISVEVGKSQILRLKSAASVVMIGEPSIADVIVERNGMIFLLGRQAGETNLFILDADGNTVLSTDIVVTPLGRRHVNVTRGTEDVAMSCNPRCAPAPTTTTVGVVNQNGGPGGAGSLGGGGLSIPPPQVPSAPSSSNNSRSE